MNSTETTLLDVTVLDPREKHPTIFRMFDDLKEGHTLTIQNDHDPKPLYYQMIHERGNIFDWEYLEKGPVWWRVNITRRKPGESSATVGELAAKDFRKAEVFKKYGIDFCCGGKRSLREVCDEKGLDIVEVERELAEKEKTKGTRPAMYDQWAPDFLADYIVNTHHSFVEKMLPDLKAYSSKVAEVHGPNHPELHTLRELVTSLNLELTDHMMKEERILFPFIKSLVVAEREGVEIRLPHFRSVNNPIHMMEHEHDAAGKLLEEIRSITNDYELPQGACASFTLLYNMLQEFEEDLHIHIHLENNILFPKAIELEKKVTSV
jgi:regulator of cell morphogenesis and NO signaling